MRLAASIAFTLVVLVTTACSGPAKKPAGPAADDVPQEVTCCFDPEVEGAPREVVPLDKCPETHRNGVDACNVGPGDAEAPM